MAAGGSLLGPVFGSPSNVVHAAGAFVIAMAGFLAFLSSRESLSRPGVWAVVGVNSGWVAAGVVVPAAGLWSTTVLGVLFILGGAVTVAVFAQLQYVGLRRMARWPARSVWRSPSRQTVVYPRPTQ